MNTAHSTTQHSQAKILQSMLRLAQVQYPCLLQRGQVSVHMSNGQKATNMEAAFRNTVDELITYRQSKHTQKKRAKKKLCDDAEP